MLSDIEIAQKTKLKGITDIGKTIGLKPEELELYGSSKAKLTYKALKRIEKLPYGKLILVSAITPTPAGEGKTTTSIGLSMALNKIGNKCIVAIREPSLGPTLGVKGGAAGGGYSQVLPMEDINLHFTGDMHAITAAHNTLAALVDNHIYSGNKLNIDPVKVVWRRVLDVNDRSLRRVIIGLGGKGQGIPREEGFDITSASEFMAILCLSNNLDELKEKIGDIIVAYTFDDQPVSVSMLGVQGSLAALLKDALRPNLVQTTENTPAFVHGGPFANIAQGANSIIATKTALRLADYVVTEAGFGFDLGAEKFFDIVCRYGQFCTSAVVLVATVRALKMHGDAKLKDLAYPDPEAVKKGLVNLEKHIENINKFGMKSVVALNRFSTDTEKEIKIITDFCRKKNTAIEIVDYFQKGSAGGLNLAEKVVGLIDKEKCELNPLYDWNSPVEEKIYKIATEIYGAVNIDFTSYARKELKKIYKHGFDKLPVCIAKTQKSLSDNPELLGRPKDFLVTVREILVAAGAGFLIPITGEIMRMPGLPKKPNAEIIDIDNDGNIKGLS
ncbi:MAG: formate--tetrahydrofolate ligase [Candidatus Cloacimonetes bacterium]|nr:formate--tetrahydrofolate ligase [Candidatus Cloacimonadota bacterium]